MIQKFIPIVFILAAAGLFFVYTNPTYTITIKEAQAELQGKQKALAAAGQFKERQAKLDVLREEITENQSKRLQTFLPDGVDNIQLIMDVNHAAAIAGVQLNGFDVKTVSSASAGKPQVITAGNAAAATTAPAPTSPGALPLQSSSPTDSIDLSVTATGTYGAFRAFLIATEHSLRPLDLMSMNIQNSDKGVYTYALTYRIYWLQ